MAQQKFDKTSLTGMLLIAGILIYMFFINKPTQEELDIQKATETEASSMEHEVWGTVKERTPDLHSHDLCKPETASPTVEL